MSVLYTSNFDSATAGNIAPGWGNVTGTWTVGTTRPISGTQSFGEASATDGNVVLLNQGAGASGIATNAQSWITYNQNPATTNGAGATVVTICPIIMSDATFANGYFCRPATSNSTWQFYKRVASVNTALGAAFSPNGFTLATATKTAIKFAYANNTLMFKIWAQTSAEPQNWGGTLYDNSITTAGYPGLYMWANGGSALAAQAVDDVTINDFNYTMTGLPKYGEGAKITANALSIKSGIPGSAASKPAPPSVHLFKMF